MAIIIDRDLTEDWNQVPVEIVRGCLELHLKEQSRLGYLENYYLGQHDILSRSLAGNTGLPNNRLVANHAKYITDVAVGYVTGNPVKYAGEGMEDIQKLYNRVDIVSHDTEMAKDLSVFGVGRELYFMTADDPPMPGVACIDPRQIFLVVDDTVEYKSLFGVHFYPKKDLSGNVNSYAVNVYTAQYITRYAVKDLGSRNYQLIDQKQHYFGAVPIVEFWNNEEQQGDFEQQISLIDAYNLLQSDRVNDKEQFVDSILKIIGASLGDDEEEYSRTITMLKKFKVLELPDGQRVDAAWLTKALNESDTEVLRNAIKSDIHEFSMVPDLTDENFAANASGVAMKYKLFGLEQLAKTKERYFVQGLRERLQLFANILRVKGKAVDVSDVEITMNRSLPANDVETAQMISTLSGNVSNETLISQLSFVRDPAEENKKVDQQKEADIERNQRAFSMPGAVNTDEDTDE